MNSTLNFTHPLLAPILTAVHRYPSFLHKIYKVAYWIITFSSLSNCKFFQYCDRWKSNNYLGCNKENKYSKANKFDSALKLFQPKKPL